MDPSASPQLPPMSAPAAPSFSGNDNILVEESSQSGVMIMYIVILIFVAAFVAYYAGFNIFTFLGVSVDELGEKVFPIWNKALEIWYNIMENVGMEVDEETRQSVEETAAGVETGADIVKRGAQEVERRAGRQTKEGEEEYDSDAEGEDAVPEPNDTNMPGTTTGKKAASASATTTSMATDVNEVTTSANEDMAVSKIMRPGGSEAPTQGELDELQYRPNDMHTSPSGSAGATKGGWCYIGTYSGYRSCSEVGSADKCMSGDIFPTQDVCVNPTMRA